MLGKFTVFIFFLLLIWGNLVAGLGAGLACPDWPLCHGNIIPPFRFDIFMEWMHRTIGLVASIFLVVLSYKRFRNYEGFAKVVPVFTVLLLLVQIVMGGIVVLLELPVNITTVHFGTALIIFSLVLYMAFFDGKEKEPTFSIKGFKGLFILLGILVFCQAVLGAYVRHSQAGLACPDFPTCLGYLIPPELSGTVLTHFLHRTLAYFIFVTVILLYAFSYLSTSLWYYRRWILTLAGLILFQILLGVSVIHSKLHFSATAFHLGAALSILSMTLYLWFQEMIRGEEESEKVENLFTYTNEMQEMRGEGKRV
ncbi:MAG TPA: COX15/CtaA family protein [Thermodesulfobacteriota bacterium]|nr:COX15/CtaA family protein [Thermodesulfobacteriota bacterium]